MSTGAQMLALEQKSAAAGSENRSRRAGYERQGRDQDDDYHQNVGVSERSVSVAAGSILVLQGLFRRDLIGLLISGVGGALAYRGVTGHCHAYGALGINTAIPDGRTSRAEIDQGARVSVSILINKSPEELYSYWRNFENLPRIMRHLESVRVLDDKRSHWIADAPTLAGGSVEWDAEITTDEANSRIAWQAMPGGDIEHHGSVTFERAPGDRGTRVRVMMEYRPPAGQIGRWIAKMFGKDPQQQIRDDLRNFKRTMEIGEVLTIGGQSHGTCLGRSKRHSEIETTQNGVDGR